MESLHNSDFKPVDYDGFKKEAGANSFTMSPTKWINGVNAIGMVSKSGRYGGTFHIQTGVADAVTELCHGINNT